ncbi:MAG: nucleotide exchange factor GrpE [Nitrospinae bacterium]|nr:nucleotide exchange factor GrpE [Nitrospinota bacterium]
MQVPIEDAELSGAGAEQEPFPVFDEPPKRGKMELKELPARREEVIAGLETRIANLTEELKKREEELAGAADRSLRAVAEAENYKKRLAREGEDRIAAAAARMLESLLPVLDNLEKALQAAGEGPGSVDRLAEGVRLTQQQFYDILTKQGLERLQVVGAQFDPDTMEAISVEETSAMSDGVVTREFLPGYRYRERLIRPARVCVAKQPSEPAAADEKGITGG